MDLKTGGRDDRIDSMKPARSRSAYVAVQCSMHSSDGAPWYPGWRRCLNRGADTVPAGSEDRARMEASTGAAARQTSGPVGTRTLDKRGPQAQERPAASRTPSADPRAGESERRRHSRHRLAHSHRPPKASSRCPGAPSSPSPDGAYRFITIEYWALALWWLPTMDIPLLSKCPVCTLAGL